MEGPKPPPCSKDQDDAGLRVSGLGLRGLGFGGLEIEGSRVYRV